MSHLLEGQHLKISVFGVRDRRVGRRDRQTKESQEQHSTYPRRLRRLRKLRWFVRGYAGNSFSMYDAAHRRWPQRYVDTGGDFHEWVGGLNNGVIPSVGITTFRSTE